MTLSTYATKVAPKSLSYCNLPLVSEVPLHKCGITLSFHRHYGYRIDSYGEAGLAFSNAIRYKHFFNGESDTKDVKRFINSLAKAYPDLHFCVCVNNFMVFDTDRNIYAIN